MRSDRTIRGQIRILNVAAREQEAAIFTVGREFRHAQVVHRTFTACQPFRVERGNNCGINLINLLNKVAQFVDERLDVHQALKVQHTQTVEVDRVRDTTYRQVLNVQGKTILPLDFTMARDAAVREDSYRTAAAAIETALAAGQDVAMVNLGDVSVYATAYYILERIRSDGFKTVMCSGVTSFCAVAARLGRSLTRMEEPLHILPGSADLDSALTLPGTKVIMKSGKAIHETAAALERRGMAANAGMVADCGLETEQVYTDLRQLPEEISYFATIVAD